MSSLTYQLISIKWQPAMNNSGYNTWIEALQKFKASPLVSGEQMKLIMFVDTNYQSNLVTTLNLIITRGRVHCTPNPMFACVFSSTRNKEHIVHGIFFVQN